VAGISPATIFSKSVGMDQEYAAGACPVTRPGG
jgi:hypothetical protein